MLRIDRYALWSVLWLLLLQAVALAQSPPANDAATRLHALFTEDWEYQMEQHPTWASGLGDRRWNDRWSDVSLTAIFNRHAHVVEILDKLTKIDRGALTPADQLNYELFKKDHEKDAEGFHYRWYLLPLNQLGGVHTVNQLVETLRFQTLKDYQDWITRLATLPTLVDQNIDLMRLGIKERIVHPKIVLQRVPAQIDHHIVTDPKASLFYAPFKNFPSSLTPVDQARLAQAAADAIAIAVVPAYRKLKDFIVNEYLPAAPDNVGVWQFPDGAAMYAYFARHNSSTDLAPQQIHEIGLQEVKRLRSQMQALIASLGFTGSFSEFAKFLRNDAKFYFRSEAELLDGYRALSRRIDPLLVNLFGILPRMPYGIEPVPANIAPDSPAGLYRGPAADGSRAGIFSINTFKPEIRPKYEMMALSLHEGVPGHHLQIALAMEQSLPNFRRYGGYTAFIEGWGLYAESLGDEMGLYDDPYAKFGQLMYEIWRASRLVVDTGIHHLRWDRRKAIDFMLENTLKQELEVAAEIDRYIVWPGQALAYKLGQLKISQLRAKAKQTLGDKFDIRRFHDEMLRDGAMPLDILETKMNAWIAEQQRAENQR
jgi:uncharacterized protein (DUF885 family)